MNAIAASEIKTLRLSIYRYDPLKEEKPYMQDFDIDIPAEKDLMVLSDNFPFSLNKGLSFLVLFPSFLISLKNSGSSNLKNVLFVFPVILSIM